MCFHLIFFITATRILIGVTFHETIPKSSPVSNCAKARDGEIRRCSEYSGDDEPPVRLKLGSNFGGGGTCDEGVSKRPPNVTTSHELSCEAKVTTKNKHKPSKTYTSTSYDGKKMIGVEHVLEAFFISLTMSASFPKQNSGISPFGDAYIRFDHTTPS